MDTKILEHIQVSVIELFAEAGLPLPTVDSPISPLAQLINSCDLTSVELPGLSSRAALRHLHGRGVPTRFHTANSEALAGYLYACGRFGCIFVEKNDLLVRRRFSCAHELGHYKLHFWPQIESAPLDEPPILEAIDRLTDKEGEDEGFLAGGEIAFTRPGTEKSQVLSDAQLEREANLFAAELLMPTSLMTNLIDKYGPPFQGEDLVWRFSTDLLVSQATMRYRLRNMGAI